MKIQLYCILIIIFTLLSSGCKSKVPPVNQNPVKMFFSVDSTRINKTVVNQKFNIQYAPPKNWNEVSDQVFSRIKNGLQSINYDSSGLTINPLNLYCTDSLKGILSLSSVEGMKSPEEYEKILSEKFGAENVKSTNYMKDDIQITQFLVETNKQVIFKIVFRSTRKNILQFDYITDRNSYMDMVKSIESSIGSIHLIHNHQ